MPVCWNSILKMPTLLARFNHSSAIALKASKLIPCHVKLCTHWKCDISGTVLSLWWIVHFTTLIYWSFWRWSAMHRPDPKWQRGSFCGKISHPAVPGPSLWSLVRVYEAWSVSMKPGLYLLACVETILCVSPCPALRCLLIFTDSHVFCNFEAVCFCILKTRLPLIKLSSKEKSD